MPIAKAVWTRGIVNWDWPKEFCPVCRRAPAIPSVAFCDSGAFCDTSLMPLCPGKLGERAASLLQRKQMRGPLRYE